MKKIKDGDILPRYTTTQKYKKYLTVKEWNRLGKTTLKRVGGYPITGQDIAVSKYDIILVNKRTKRETLKFVLDEYPKYVDRGLTMFSKGMNQFDKAMNETFKQFGEGLGEQKFKSEKDVKRAFWG